MNLRLRHLALVLAGWRSLSRRYHHLHAAIRLAVRISTHGRHTAGLRDQSGHVPFGNFLAAIAVPVDTLLRIRDQSHAAGRGGIGRSRSCTPVRADPLESRRGASPTGVVEVTGRAVPHAERLSTTTTASAPPASVCSGTSEVVTAR